MPLTARLDSPAALYRKLEREAYRAYHAPTPLAKADHFYNFCVTASSMRDYCLEKVGATTRTLRKPYDAVWWKEPLLVAAIEIGNSTKHFVLRDPNTGTPKTIQTRASRMKKTRFIDVFTNESGDVLLKEVQKAEVGVTLSDNTRLELHEFTGALLTYWKDYLASIGVKVRRQPFAQLAGGAA
jgi:hypothetical protein